MSAFEALTYLSALGAVVLLWDALRAPSPRNEAPVVEIAPAVVIAFFSAVAVVSIFACGYQAALMRSDRARAELAPAAPSRHAAGVARVLTIQPDTERGITPAVRFVVPVGRAA